MRLVMEERGNDPELTDDERLVYEAILRKGCLLGVGGVTGWGRKETQTRKGAIAL